MNRNQRRLADKQGRTLFGEAARLHRAGRLTDAEAAYRSLLAMDPRHPDSLHGLGLIASQTGRHEAAVELILRAIAINGAEPAYHTNLGNAMKDQGRFSDAAICYGRALALKPDDVAASLNLANVRLAQGGFGEAEALYMRILAIDPRHADNLHGLGMIAYNAGRHALAVNLIGRAIAINAEVAVYHINLGNALKDQGRYGEAIASYERALPLTPGAAAIHTLVANALMLQGEIDAAVTRFERALAFDPGAAVAQSNRLFCLNYSERPAADIFAEHRGWGRAQARSLPAPAAHRNDRDPGRRLRIGYVSSDFKHHPVASFLSPLLAAHDHEAVEVFCYSGVANPDAVTERLERQADHWRTIAEVPDEAVVETIRADGIDILVDLAGHSAGNRLALFARKPAPVQISWLGYPNTTGLSAIDYRLVDEITDPTGQADALASERLVRVEDGFLCYAPNEAPEPGPPPSLAKGFVTFGSFNFASKLSDGTLETWARLLVRAPSARLLLKGSFLTDEAMRERVHARLGGLGVAPEQIQFLGWTASQADHLALYGDIDIALDPFPYNGTTTTCEALWMGVPVVTVMGERHAGRVTASLLTRVGLDALIAADVGDYVEIAARLAEDPARLAAIRAALRPRMAASALCDAPAFARKIESAYRRMWTTWTSQG